MKIAFITSHIDASKQWLWFAEEIRNRGIDQIHIIIESQPTIMHRELTEAGIKTYFLKSSGWWSHLVNFFKVRSILKENNIDLVHTELPFGNLIGLPAAWAAGIKKRVNTCENASWAIDYHSKKQLFIDKLAYLLAKRIIVLTELSKDYLAEHYGVNRDIITVIGHSIKTDDYNNISPERIQKLKAELGVKETDFVIGMVARLEDWKGHRYVIEALKDLVPQYPNIKLLIFGSAGDYLAVIENMVKEYNLEQHVFYKGFVTDNIALYKLFNIHVHVPINEIVETFGISIIEGMISEVPQILTKSGISCFTVRHMENCIEVPYKNSEKIKEAIAFIINNETTAKQLAHTAREDAIRMFSYKSKVDKHIAVYESM